MDDNIKCIVLLSVAAAILWSAFATEAEDGAVIYIKPSPDAVCSGEPCYTLSQFAANQRGKWKRMKRKTETENWNGKQKRKS